MVALIASENWRAPSSPHLACVLNRPSFLHCCTKLSVAKAGRSYDVRGWIKTCESLHRVVKKHWIAAAVQSVPCDVCQENIVFQEAIGKT